MVTRAPAGAANSRSRRFEANIRTASVSAAVHSRMKEATKRAASEALAQMLAVTAMLVIASVVFYVR